MAEGKWVSYLRVSAPDCKGAAARVWKHTVLQSRIAEHRRAVAARSRNAALAVREVGSGADRRRFQLVSKLAGADPAEDQCHTETKRCQVAK